MDYDLRQLQRVILIIAKELKRICEKNHIRYTLIGGSLIGAVRHKGFIPWDDDFDVVMPREDYERFLKCCETDLSSNFSLLNWDTNAAYCMACSKLLLKGTKVMEAFHQAKGYPHNLYIDIFPFDTIPDDPKLRKQHEKKTYFYKKMLLCKQGGNEYYKNFEGKKRIGYALMCAGSKFLQRENLIRKYREEMLRYKGDTLDYTSIAGSYGYSREIIPHSMLENYIKMEFEDTTFSVMKDYDVYLRMVFGDYMQLPPEEKRVNHSFLRVDLGKYARISE